MSTNTKNHKEPVLRETLSLPFKPSTVVKQDNLMTEAKYELNTLEKNLFVYLCSLFREEDREEKKYIIHIKELERLTGRKTSYPRYREAAKKLRERTIEIRGHHRNSKGKIQRGTLYIGFLEYVLCFPKSDIIEVSVSKHLRPYLFELQSRFTLYGLEESMKLESIYAKRIYELISQWRSVESKEFHIKELREMLALDPTSSKKSSYLNSFAKFRENVLEKARQEINEKTSVELSYTLRKTGRTYSHVHFHYRFPTKKTVVTAIEKRQPTEKQPSTPINRNLIRMVSLFKVPHDLAQKALQILPKEIINKRLYEIQLLNADRKIDNIRAYTSKVLREEIKNASTD